jgi:hypothetical protein
MLVTLPHLLEQAEQHVCVDGALVRLVQDDDAGLNMYKLAVKT